MPSRRHLLLPAILALNAWAADHRGIVESDGLPIPGATVTARLGESVFQTTTGADGDYSFSSLAEGTWRIEIDMPGFGRVSGDVAVPDREQAQWNLTMEGAEEEAPADPEAPPAPKPGRPTVSLTATAPAPAVPAETESEELAASANEAVLVGGAEPAVRGRARAKYRGSAGFSLDNSVWDARPYSLTGREIDKPSFAKARVSLAFGGPLRIPKVLTGENTSFNLGYSGGRSRNWTRFVSTMPSELERAGDFSQSVQRGPVAIYDPLDGRPFAGNRLPASRIDPAAAALSRYLPQPNQPAQVRNYQYVAGVPQDSDSASLSVNHRVARRHRLSGRVSRFSSAGLRPQLIGVEDASDGRSWNAGLTWNYNIAPRLISAARLNFSLQRNRTIPYFAFRENVAEELGIAGTARDPQNWGPPNLSFTNFGGLSAANASRAANQTGTLSESLTWNRKKHNLSFGIEYSRRWMNRVADLNARGSMSFTGIATSGAGADGFDFADFLLGLPAASSVRFGGGDTYFRANGYGVFVQDDWRMASRFTLNLGLRYDYASPIREKHNRMANLAVAPGFTGAEPLLWPDTLVRPDRNNFSPRLALAWRPSLRRSAVVRAGYGWYFNSNIYGGVADSLAQQPPFARASTVATSADRVLTIRDAFGGALVRQIDNTYAVDPAYRVGYAQSWNVAVQQNLGSVLVGEVTYLGTKGTGLDMLRIPSRALPASVAPFIYESSEGNSIYHGASGRVSRRFSGGLTAQARYTYGRSIDNASSVTGSGAGWIAQDAFNLAAERGLSSFDNRHLVDANWQFSSGKRNSRLFREWMLSNTITFRSGTPLTATVLGNRADVAGTGVVGTVRADATGLPVRAGPGFFNLAAFDVPPLGQFGNAGRGTIPGPGMFLMNASVSRSIPLGEGRAIEFRADASNVLNRVNIAAIGTVVNASSFGLATAAASMRSLTLNARVRF
ncbi:MAG: TonB-dependent receptor [Bryobacteraceae bacterium]|nr:TonB-dependent receptor [Bryobacteraceae bacterium]